MLKQAMDLGKQLLSLTRDTQQNKEDVKALREEVREIRRELAEMRQTDAQVRNEMNQQRIEVVNLTRLVEHLILELKHQQENAAKERENQELRIQLMMLRHERSLPPGDIENKKP